MDAKTQNTDYLSLARELLPNHDLTRMSAGEIVTALKGTDWYKARLKLLEDWKPLTHNELRAVLGG